MIKLLESSIWVQNVGEISFLMISVTICDVPVHITGRLYEDCMECRMSVVCALDMAAFSMRCIPLSMV